MSKPIVYNLDTCIIIEILRSNPVVVNNMLKAFGIDNTKHFDRVPDLKVISWKDLGD